MSRLFRICCQWQKQFKFCHCQANENKITTVFDADADAKQIETKSKCNRARKSKAESNRIIATLAWKSHAHSRPHLWEWKWVGKGKRQYADIYSRLIFMVTIFAFNRKSMKFLCLRLGAPLFYLCLCVFLHVLAKIFHFKCFRFMCVTHSSTCHTHTHTRTSPKHLQSAWFSILLFFHPSNLGNLAA